MSFDSLTLRSVVSQLNETITSGKVANVVQLSPFDIILRIISTDRAYNLLISIHPVYARIHLTSEYPKSQKRWHFADFLQNHVKDGKIESIEQIDFDRIIKIRIIPPEDIITPAPKVLIGEFMGKHSNLTILEEGTNRILESMKHVDEDVNRYRQILPGLTYVMPPANKGIDPFSADESTILSILKSGSEKASQPVGQASLLVISGKDAQPTKKYNSLDNEKPWNKILKNFQGMSPLLAREIVARSTDESPEAIQRSFMDMIDQIKNGNLKPTVITKDDDVIDVAAIDLHQFKDSNSISFPNISEALEFYYKRNIQKELIKSEKAAIIQAVTKKYEALKEKHESLQKQLEIAEKADDLKLIGDLLIANLHAFKRGQKEVKLTNYYKPESAEMIVQLDEKISPSDNAQRYYEEYKKAKRSKDVVEKLIRKNKSEMDFMSQAIHEAENAKDLDTLGPIRDRLARKGIIKEKTEGPRKPKEEISLFRRYVSSEGFQMFVGRNEKENDLLVKGESSKSDMWLHAKQIEGSHVLIKNPDRRPDIPKRTLLEAAIIAARFSKAQHSTMVPVDYTWVKYVNKPKGGKPGFVIYTHEKTLFVSPADFTSLFSAATTL